MSNIDRCLDFTKRQSAAPTSPPGPRVVNYPPAAAAPCLLTWPAHDKNGINKSETAEEWHPLRRGSAIVRGDQWVSGIPYLLIHLERNVCVLWHYHIILHGPWGPHWSGGGGGRKPFCFTFCWRIDCGTGLYKSDRKWDPHKRGH